MEIFTVECANVAVSAAQDILAVYAASTKKLQVLAIEIAANGQTTVGNYPIRLVRFASGYTPGTGGTGVTPNNVNVDGASPSFTAARNNTTQTSGTSVVYIASQFNPINGYYWQAPTGVGDEPKFDLSQAAVLSLDGITGTLNVSATIWVRET